MDLRSVELQTTWNEAASTINENNQKIAIEIAKLGVSGAGSEGGGSSPLTPEPNASQVQITIDQVNGIIGAYLVKGGISTSHISASAVTTDKIADGSITKSKLDASIKNVLLPSMFFIGSMGNSYNSYLKKSSNSSSDAVVLDVNVTPLESGAVGLAESTNVRAYVDNKVQNAGGGSGMPYTILSTSAYEFFQGFFDGEFSEIPEDDYNAIRDAMLNDKLAFLPDPYGLGGQGNGLCPIFGIYEDDSLSFSVIWMGKSYNVAIDSSSYEIRGISDANAEGGSQPAPSAGAGVYKTNFTISDATNEDWTDIDQEDVDGIISCAGSTFKQLVIPTGGRTPGNVIASAVYYENDYYNFEFHYKGAYYKVACNANDAILEEVTTY